MTHFKLKIFITLAVVLSVFSFFYFQYKKGDSEKREVINVRRSDVVQHVTVTGITKSSETVDLAFERLGKVSKILIKVGDRVKAGQLLASLDNRDLSAQVSQASASLENTQAALKQLEAALDVQKAKMAELKKGTRDEEIKIIESRVHQAQQALSDANINYENIRVKNETDLNNLYSDVSEITNDALIKAEDAVKKQTDDLFINDDSNNPQLSFAVSESQIESDVRTSRIQANTSLSVWRTELSSINSASPQAKQELALQNSKNYLLSIRDFLTETMDALNVSTGLSSSTVNTYKTNLTTARTNASLSLTSVSNHWQNILNQKITNQNSISSAQTKINDTKSALLTLESELALKHAGATPEQLAAQEAYVKQAEANISAQQAQIKRSQAEVLGRQAELSKSIIRSPIDGIVTRQDAKLGSVVASNITIITLIAEKSLEIEANVPEIDISKVTIEQRVQITLDALPGEEFSGKIFKIDPAETIIDGVVNYKVKITFDQLNEMVKSGLTANLAIETLRKPQVITVPQIAVFERDGNAYVKKEVDGTIKDIVIQTGVISVDGNVEILAGLEQGDRVINTAIKNAKR